MIYADTRQETKLCSRLFFSKQYLLYLPFLLSVLTSLAYLPQLVTETTYATSLLANLAFRSNFHEVYPGRLYRSGELSAEHLKEVVEDYGIKTVVDLRTSPSERLENGYTEATWLKSLGVKHIHLRMVSSNPYQLGEIKKLLAIYRREKEPLLVHCTSGTHRTGLAASMWLVTQAEAGLDESSAQLRAAFGYFRVERLVKAWFQGHPTLDDVWWSFSAWERRHKAGFEAWLTGAGQRKYGTRPVNTLARTSDPAQTDD